MLDMNGENIQTEIDSIILQSHGISKHMPFYVKTSRNQRYMNNNMVKGFPLNIFSQKDKLIAVIYNHKNKNKNEYFSFWDKLNRFMYFTRLYVFPNIKKKMRRNTL